MSDLCTLPPRQAFRPARRPSRWILVLCGVLLTLAACGSRPAVESGTTASETWEAIALPTPAAETQDFVVSPVDPALLFDCTADLQMTGPDGSASPAPMTLWRSTDTGAHWTRSSIALGSGTECLISIAPDDPSRLTLQVAPSNQETQPCAHEVFYLSDDSGMTWRPLPPHPPSFAPTSAEFGWCQLQATAQHLFLVYSYGVSNPSQGPQVSLLERSDDGGSTWTRADRGLGSDSLFFMPEIGPGDMLAMTVVHPTTPAEQYTAELWTSADAGQTWQLASTLPDYPGASMLAARARSGVTWPGQGQPFYALEAEQLPSDLYYERVLQSGDGQHWSLLPVLPVSGTSSERGGILQVLAELPDGRLAVWGADPRAGLPAPKAVPYLMSTFWLWLWNPAASQWQALSLPLKVTANESCGLCWSAETSVGADGAPYLYLQYNETVMSGPQPGVFRIRLAMPA